MSGRGRAPHRAPAPDPAPRRVRHGEETESTAVRARMEDRRMDTETGAGLLHTLTSYAVGREWDVPVDDPRVRHDLVPNDPETEPPPMKTYPEGLPVVPLPEEW